MKKFIQIGWILILCWGINIHESYAQSTPKEFFVYVSNSDKESNEGGILSYHFNAENGALTPLSAHKQLKSTGYLNISPHQKYLYAVGNHLDGEYISAFEINSQSGELTLINQQRIAGRGACYVSVDNQNQYALVANYSSANAYSFKIEPNGAIGEVAGQITHTGKSINTDRQNEPHPHMILPAPQNNIVLVPDLGTDKTMIYKLDPITGKLNPSGNLFGQSPAGGGPRHFVFHPKGKFGYVLNELVGSVTAFKYNKKDGSLAALQTTGILPADFKAFNKSADIHITPNAQYLYASNRGHHSIAVVEIHPKTGLLTYKGTFDCGGETPRAFGIDPTGNFLLVANLDSDNISIFKINYQTGFADKVGAVMAQSPQAVKFLPKK
jgi:6-phosphogluconolactonase